MTVVPVYNIVLVPDANMYLRTETYQNMTGKSPKIGERVMMIALRERKTRDQFAEDSFYPIGVTGEVIEHSPENGFLVIHTGERRNLDQVTVYSDHSIELGVSRREAIDDLDPELENGYLRHGAFAHRGIGAGDDSRRGRPALGERNPHLSGADQ